MERTHCKRIVTIVACLSLPIVGLGKEPKPNTTLTVASCQFPVSADLEANGYWIKRQMREAAQSGADVAHFCEGALTGYIDADHKSFDKFDWDALYVEMESILELAKELKLWVVLGSMHRLTGEHMPHNSLYIINDKGEIIDRYDKRFCTPIDVKHYTPGDHFTVFEINGVKCGALICYDIRFPELYRQYCKLGVRLMFHSFYNARQKEGSIHPIIMPITARARAASNNMFVSLTNSSAPRSWPCYMITPDGLVAGRLADDEPGVLISKVDPGENYYDASHFYRLDCINGKLNSGETVEDAKSKERTSYR
jgi:predicted amidohydrolase